MRAGKLTEFFQAEYGKLVRVVRRWIDDTADRDAEDIVQDVMTNIFDKADVTLPIDNLTAFVYRSLKNRVVDTFRKQSKRTHVSLDAGFDSANGLSLAELVRDAGAGVESEEERYELYSMLYSSIDALNEKEKEIIIATEFDGLSFRQLSEQWKAPMGTLLARKSRALKKIRQLIENEFMDAAVNGRLWKEK